MAKKKKRGLKGFAKKVGRLHAKVFAKTAKFVTPVLSAAATVFGGPGAGLAITAAGAGIAQYAGATAARAKGIKGRAARAQGHKLRAKVLKTGLLGVGGGLAIGAGIAAAAGTGATAVLTGAGRAALSKGSAPAPATEAQSPFVTQSDLAKSLAAPGQTASNNGILEGGAGVLGLAAKNFLGGQNPTGGINLNQVLPGLGDATGLDGTQGDNAAAQGIGQSGEEGGFLSTVPGPVKLVGALVLAFLAYKAWRKAA